MKRIRIPGLVDIVSSDDASEIENLAQNPNLDRAYTDRSLTVNSLIIKRVRDALQIGGRPFPTVAPKADESRAASQQALWSRLSALAATYAQGPDELEPLAAFVRGNGPSDGCGILVQHVVGRLFAPNFTATQDSWNAALVLNQAPRTMNPALLAWWALTHRVDRAKQLLADMVAGDLAAVHAVGVALHNIVAGVVLMRQLYGDSNRRSALSPQSASSQCLFAPETVLRQPIATVDSAQGRLETGTLVILKLQDANKITPDMNVCFLRETWSRCPAEQWVPALLQGIWRRACMSPQP
jgi:hypothetical protein